MKRLDHRLSDIRMDRSIDYVDRHQPVIGWDTTLFLDRTDAITCRICTCVYRDATTLSCGHTFCDACINTRIKCALCNEPMTDMVPDHRLQHCIMGLHVKCIHTGCTVTGTLRAMKDHGLYCLDRLEECVDCRCVVKSRYVKRHRTYECIHRSVTCTTCTQTYRQSVGHLCPKTDTSCD